MNTVQCDRSFSRLVGWLVGWIRCDPSRMRPNSVAQVRSQQIHLFQIQRSGRLLHVNSMGHERCNADDDLSLRTAEAAEERWRLASAAAGSEDRPRGSSDFSLSQLTGRKRPAESDDFGACRRASGSFASTPGAEARRNHAARDDATEVPSITGVGGEPQHIPRPGGGIPDESEGVTRRQGPSGGLLVPPSVPPPPPPSSVKPSSLISGIRQRTLAHLFKARLKMGGSSGRKQQVVQTVKEQMYLSVCAHHSG